jgi:hypothetical protein
MPTASVNRPWNLEAFIDSFVVELDKARDTLAVKAFTRPSSYNVQEAELDLQIFPQYDGKDVTFVTAQPGQQGASALKIQLGSITARGIRETTPEPITRDDVSIEFLDDIDAEAKESLRKIGIKSAKDLERVEERNVDIQNVTDNKLDYQNLANVINRAKRRQQPPMVSKAGVAQSAGEPVLALSGDNLVLGESLPDFPIALLDGKRVEVLSASDRHLHLRVAPDDLAGRTRKLDVALDPFAVISMELNA